MSDAELLFAVRNCIKVNIEKSNRGELFKSPEIAVNTAMEDLGIDFECMEMILNSSPFESNNRLPDDFYRRAIAYMTLNGGSCRVKRAPLPSMNFMTCGSEKTTNNRVVHHLF